MPFEEAVVVVGADAEVEAKEDEVEATKHKGSLKMAWISAMPPVGLTLMNGQSCHRRHNRKFSTIPHAPPQWNNDVRNAKLAQSRQVPPVKTSRTGRLLQL